MKIAGRMETLGRMETVGCVGTRVECVKIAGYVETVRHVETVGRGCVGTIGCVEIAGCMETTPSVEILFDICYFGASIFRGKFYSSDFFCLKTHAAYMLCH